MSTRYRMVCTPLFDIPYIPGPPGNQDPQRTKAAKGYADPTWRDRHLGAGWMLPLWECPPRYATFERGEGKSANPPRVRSAKPCHVMQCFGRIDVCKSSTRSARHLGLNFVQCNPTLICWGKSRGGRGLGGGPPPCLSPVLHARSDPGIANACDASLGYALESETAMP